MQINLTESQARVVLLSLQQTHSSCRSELRNLMGDSGVLMNLTREIVRDQLTTLETAIGMLDPNWTPTPEYLIAADDFGDD